MIITYHGHSEFLLETQSGYRVLTDPFNASVGYPMREITADAVTVSHEHGDHAEVGKVLGHPRVVREAGVTGLCPGVRVTGIPSVHDASGGAERGANMIYLIEADGLRVAHLGDQGTLLTDAQTAALGLVDILMIPVGGFYTIDARAAEETIAALRPRVSIPMHYKTGVNASWPIATLDNFLAGRKIAPQPLLRVSGGDVSEVQSLVCLQISG